MNKFQIRQKILKIRKTKLKDSFINPRKILNIIKRKKISGKIIGGYYPFQNEIDDMEILKKLEKYKYIISLPKIKNNNQMDFFEWSFRDPLTINKYGIPEPSSGKIVYPDILIIPLVAFDKKLYRIGYGGGFYDRYLKKMINKKRNIMSIGLGFSFQEVKKIPINKFDIKLDLIITENRNFE